MATLEGAEFFYAADGRFIGLISGSSEVRVVDEESVEEVSKWINWTIGTRNVGRTEAAAYNKKQAYRLSHQITPSEAEDLAINNYDPSAHVYTWGDPALKGYAAYCRNNLDPEKTCIPANRNCADLAKAQANELGTKLKGVEVNTTHLFVLYNADIDLLSDIEEDVIGYINAQLEAGNVVVVGVHDGDPGSTDNYGSDHFVTIVGRDFENGEGYYFFIEDAVVSPEDATNFDENRLSAGKGNSGLSGSTTWGDSRGQDIQLDVTRVQKNQ